MSKHLASTGVFDVVQKLEVVFLNKSMNISKQTPEDQIHYPVPVVEDRQTDQNLHMKKTSENLQQKILSKKNVHGTCKITTIRYSIYTLSGTVEQLINQAICTKRCSERVYQ